MNNTIYRGILTDKGDHPFLLGEDGSRIFEDETIWSGYVRHWNGKKVCARRLPQKDYETGRPMVILWPDEPAPAKPFTEIYFNERLVKYPASFLGHMAANVNGEIFNFSHKINENEAMRHEEYFYRPALGQFAPHPITGRDNDDDPQKPYYDKFGRLFMRTIHVLGITGLDTQKLSDILQSELDAIHNAPPDPQRPGYYRDFNFFTRSCSTIVRDGLRKLGFKKIAGIFPRDLFINAAYYFSRRIEAPEIRISLRTLPQLSVPEAAPSALPPLLNPVNLYRYGQLKQRLTNP